MSHKYEKGCVMFKLSIDNWADIIKQIDKEDLYEVETDDSFGLETEPHVTVIFGIVDDYDNVVDFCKENLNSVNVNLTKVSCFENEFDVLKYEVESEGLSEFNELLKTAFKCDITYPDYKPHVTLAYLKKGKAKKYIDGDYDFPKIELNSDECMFTYPEDNKESFKVTSKELKEEVNRIKRYF